MKFLSYLLPRRLEQGKTESGQYYEVNLENGVKVLNSANTNYSYGSLHDIMLRGITEVFKKHRPHKILMLGLGAGSALKIFEKKAKWSYSVDVIEFDKGLIEIANRHFDVKDSENIRIIHDDAYKYVTSIGDSTYDFILDDVFLDDYIPGFCFSDEYLEAIQKKLNHEGVYLRNTMQHNREETKSYEHKLKRYFPGYYSLKDPKHGNKIYFCQSSHEPQKR